MVYSYIYWFGGAQRKKMKLPIKPNSMKENLMGVHSMGLKVSFVLFV